MDKFKFRVIEKCFQDASSHKDDDVDFLLEENDWNDFYYHTLYHIHLSARRTGGKPRYLGPIRIMRHDQEKYEDGLVRKMAFNDGTFFHLEDNFVSRIGSLDTANALMQVLRTKEERECFIKSLRIILSEKDEWFDAVKDDECFQKSLCRSTNLKDAVSKEIRYLFLSEGVEYNLREKTMTIQYPDCARSVELKFNNVAGNDTKLMPNGMIAFIGKNGAGKSHAMYSLASLLYASPAEREWLEHIGTIHPKDILIRKLFILSYSPFDRFLLPGQNDLSSLQSWVQNMKSHTGRFIYCGLRDVISEAEELIEWHKTNDNKNHDKKVVHSPVSVLKKPTALSEEGFEAYKIIENNDHKRKIYHSLTSDMKNQGHEELYEIACNLNCCLNEEEWCSYFNTLSTGHKFVFHALLNIIAFIGNNSLLIFDEPENHLQAPLLSFLMAELRKVLFTFKSAMLISTHSPIILQEILSENVRVVRRFGETFTLDKPNIETFGESYGNISSEVFDMTTDRNYFFRTLDNIYLQNEPFEKPEDVIETFNAVFGSLSNQAESYILSRYFEDVDC